MKFLSTREQGFGGKKIPKQFRISEKNLEALKNLSNLYGKSDSEIINEFLLVETNKQNIFKKILKNISEKGNCVISNIVPVFVGFWNQNTFSPDGVFQTTISYTANEYIKITLTKSLNPNFEFFLNMEKRIQFLPLGGGNTLENVFFGTKDIKNEMELISIFESFDWTLEENFIIIE